MAAFRDRVICPACGRLADVTSFGAEHDLLLLRQYFLGRAQIETERLPVPQEILLQLRDALREAHERVDAALEGADDT